MIYIAKIFALFLGSLVITKSFHDFRRGKENVTMFSFWTITWIAVIVVALDPLIIENVMRRFGGRTGIGTFTSMALVFILYVLYRVYQKSNRIENQLREMVTKLGLKDLEG
jgi:hypothetical protein